jgi:RNA polymerase sigma-54 factor
MHLNISQQMKMGQQMKLAPRMIQSMEILQLSVLALQERVEQELAENVVLESNLEDANVTDTEINREIEKSHEVAESSPLDEKELVVDPDKNNEADFERLLEMSQDWPEDNISAGAKVSSNRVDEMGDRQHDAMTNMEGRPQSLHEYLVEQFGFFNYPEAVREFGEYLIQNLDENGRLPGTLPEIVQVYGKSVEMDEAEYALELIQKLDPAGVGARDYKECLLLQIKENNPYADVLHTLITSHLEDIQQNRLPVIHRKTGYAIEEIKDAILYLQKLNPWPGRGFETRAVQRVTPDLSVELVKDRYVVKLENEYVPELRISPRYVKMLKAKPDEKTKEYIKKKIESAQWLIDSIAQRQNTLKKVAQSIVDRQSEFLNKGPEHINPLKMQQVADDVKVHVTTVSRAVDDKWIQTPRGLFPLKRFFGGGTQTAGGEEVAWDIIRLKMKDIVDNEDKKHPLSDDALVLKLAEHGYKLARRTVTKYRKKLDIPSSRQRREY